VTSRMIEQTLVARQTRVVNPLTLVARGLITVYQHTLSPLLGSSCRFSPSCSRYAHEAIGEHGFFKGSWMGMRRIGRCTPFSEGGYDPVPDWEGSR
jgi:putative membrane protein insertion efficiency factor